MEIKKIQISDDNNQITIVFSDKLYSNNNNVIANINKKNFLLSLEGGTATFSGGETNSYIPDSIIDNDKTIILNIVLFGDADGNEILNIEFLDILDLNKNKIELEQIRINLNLSKWHIQGGLLYLENNDLSNTLFTTNNSNPICQFVRNKETDKSSFIMGMDGNNFRFGWTSINDYTKKYEGLNRIEDYLTFDDNNKLVIGKGLRGLAKSKKWLTNSDKNLKENIEKLKSDECLDKILSLNGVYFNWKDDICAKNINIGLIAQEVEEILPECVYIDKSGYKSVAYSNINVVLMEAFKETYQMVKDTTMQIQILEKKLIEIKNKKK